jgi:hypothetical protein
MGFSETARGYLKKLVRDEAFVVPDRQTVAAHLKNHRIPISDRILDFQMNFSGLELTVANKSGETFQAALFSRADILENRPPEAINLNGQWYFHCGEHATAQFWFVIGSEGQFGTFDYHDEVLNILASSFDKWVESYAYMDALLQNHPYEHPYFYELLDPVGFGALVQNLVRYHPACDAYTQWMSDDNLTVHQGTWFDRPGFFLHLYSKNMEYCESFVHLLKEKWIVS